MAEVIYPRTSGAIVDGDRFTILGDRPGPAGISSVTFPNGDIWLIVTTVVSDPRYLLNDYTTSTHFKREADGAKWKPTPCRA